MMRNIIFLCVCIFVFSCSNGNSGSVSSGEKFNTQGFELRKIPNTDLTSVVKTDEAGKLIQEGYLKNGKKHSMWLEYDPESSHVIALNNYNEGVLMGPQFEYNSRGQLKKRTTYLNNTLDGLTIEYQNGRFLKEITYKNGVVDGYIKDYNSKAKLFKYTEYKNNQLDGKVITYNDEGKKILEYVYKDGKQISGGLVE